ncbi:MAG: MMPL family transporter [Proteobacteria bacterium]|nr:MMPL family transporter [Pseudomonadota bacterium]
MLAIQRLIARAYSWCLVHPVGVLLALLIVLSACVYHSRGFYYDASADTLVAENDPELRYYRKVSKNFGGEDFLFLTYTPKNKPLFTRDVLNDVEAVIAKLKAIDGVQSVDSMLDAPLLKSPPMPIQDLAKNFHTLRSNDVDLDAARVELSTSPLFKNLLVSADAKTTTLRINLAPDAKLAAISQRRQALRALEHPGVEEQAELDDINTRYREIYAASMKNFDRVLEEIRAVGSSFADKATIHLGGVPMIAADMIGYIKRDVILFGGSSLLLMIGALYIFFRNIRWVMLPVLVTMATVTATVGILGWLHKPVTVISSNFISLLIIFSISVVVHLITRYLEEVENYPERSQRDTVYATMASKLAPSIYTTLTTMAGFASLYTSSILPVMDFGWIMCLGVVVSFVMAYTIFPAAMMLLPCSKLVSSTRDTATPLVRLSYHFASRRTLGVILVSCLLAAGTVLGMLRINLDNRFLDYFRHSTDIYQSLAFIDRNLGGTIPMDVVINFPPYQAEVASDDDMFADPTATADPYPQKYWFTPDKIRVLHRLHNYLATRPEVGKTISLATFEEIAQEFNGGQTLTAPEIVAVLGAIPDELRHDFIEPYANPDSGMMRLNMRIHETGPKYPRARLIEEVKTYATTELGLPAENVHITGMNVLFNGMLQELFTSQTSTLFFVVAATFLMFVVLLRSVKLAVIGLLPNVLAAFSMLAFMGYLNIPLDMMTITIAAIVIGIGVDDAIHYLHRFRESFGMTKSVDMSIRQSHREIGRAMYFTTLTVVIGFLVLVLSNFIPSVYFGLLTSVAMTFALLANLTLLPALLIKFYR